MEEFTNCIGPDDTLPKFKAYYILENRRPLARAKRSLVKFARQWLAARARELGSIKVAQS